MLKTNVISNFLGSGYITILQFALVPILLKYLGAEAYGLIGIYMTLLAVLNILDMGLSPALSRELARLSALPNSAHLMRSTVTTLECIYFVIAILIAVIFYFASPLIADFWLNKNNLPTQTITVCLQLMGAQCALQFLTNYYTNGLNGLQRMVRANAVLSVNHTLRALAGLAVLVFWAANIKFYFLSQVILTFFGLCLTVFALYQVMPIDQTQYLTVSKWQKIKSRFNIERLQACKRFATGMAVISVLSVIITQIDKIILSKLVSLEEFGYYAVAVNIAVTIAGAAGLISKSVLPRMTQLVATNDTQILKDLYLKSSTTVAWLVLPIAGLIILFSQQFLTIYLGGTDKVALVAPVLVLLMFGYAVHSLMSIPYALSLAYGWTRYGINTSLVAILVMTPVTIFAVLNYGVIGAAASWVLLSIGYLCFSLFYLHYTIHQDLLLNFYKKISIPVLILVLCFLSNFLI